MFEDNNQKRPPHSLRRSSPAGDAVVQQRAAPSPAKNVQQRAIWKVCCPRTSKPSEEQAELCLSPVHGVWQTTWTSAHLFAQHPGYQETLLPPAEQPSHRTLLAVHLHLDGRQGVRGVLQHLSSCPSASFISYPDKDRIDDMLQNATKQNVKVIVVTDGERILAPRDQGHRRHGHSHRQYTPPVAASPRPTAAGGAGCGHQQPAVAERPLLHGVAPSAHLWRRVRRVRRCLHPGGQAPLAGHPAAVRGFRPGQCHPLLNRYKDELCCFNDDIPGTAAVTLGSPHRRLQGLRCQTLRESGSFSGRAVPGAASPSRSWRR